MPCPKGVTEVPLISAVRLLLKSPSFLLLWAELCTQWVLIECL